MPLEDVDFMKRHSEIDSRLIFIDSSKRDKTAYPYPHKYTVSFNDPFTNVCGMEILDAMIISTMYNVESFGNKFKYHQVYLQKHDINNEILSKYLNELEKNINFKNRIYSQFNNRIIICEDLSVDPSIPDSKEDGLILLCIRKTIPILKKHDISYIVDPVDKDKFTITESNNIYVFEESLINENILKNGYLLENENLVFYETHYYNISEYNVLYNLSLEKQLFVIHNAFVAISPGNYNIRDFKDEMNILLTSINDTDPWAYTLPFFENYVNIYNGYNASNIERNMKYELRIADHNRNRILIFPDICGMKDTLGCNIPKDLNDTDRFDYLKFGNINGLLSTSIDGDSILTFPGVVNFASNVRYMLLRCPEIETHLHNSFSSSSFCTGIGLFKHTGNYDQNNYRFDFTNFNKKPFHPIGKLGKITLSFELPDGRPYDFKGVDHILILSIKYYKPSLRQDNVTGDNNMYSLNPDYNPDFLDYMIKRNNVKHDVIDKVYSRDDNDNDGIQYDFQDYIHDDSNSDLDESHININEINSFLNEKLDYEF